MSRADEPAYTWGPVSLTRDEFGDYIKPIYEDGMSIRRLANLTDHTPAYIRALLVEHGATIRPRSKPRRTRLTKAQREARADSEARGIVHPPMRPKRLAVIHPVYTWRDLDEEAG